MSDPIIAESTMSPKRRPRLLKWGVFFSLIGLILFVVAFSYGYFELAKINMRLAGVVGGLQKRLQENQSVTAQLQQSVQGLQQANTKNQALFSQQEKLLAEWQSIQKGDLDRWHVAEAQYLVRLANDYLQYAHDSTLAKTLLERATHALQEVSDPNLMNVRKSLAADFAKLEATPQANITDTYLRLAALDTQFEQLPLPANPLQAEKTDAPIPSTLPWWKAGLEHSWQALSKIVIVRYNGANALPLVLPDEKKYLYLNLHGQMQQAMWGVLHRNNEIYQASLVRILTWLPEYFVADAPQTKLMIQNLETLRKVSLLTVDINLADTLQRFDEYLASSQQPKSV